MGWWAGGLVLFDDVCAARPLLYFLRALGYALGLANEGFAFLFWGSGTCGPYLLLFFQSTHFGLAKLPSFYARISA